MVNAPGAAELPGLIRQLRQLVGQLEHLFPERRFTLDGHLLGSIGEVLAAQIYGLLTLLSMAAPTHDAVTESGTRVQIKVTQGDRVALRAEPEHLLVLQLTDDGGAVEVYNGPGRPAWQKSGKMQRNGQQQISVAQLRGLMASVPESQRIPRIIQ